MPHPPPPPGAPTRFHDSDRVRAALPTKAPQAPTVPLQPLPSAAPGSHTAGAAADHVRLGWRGLTAAVPVTLITALATALLTHWASPAGLPPDDSLRSQVRDVAADVREIKAAVREQRTALAEERAFTSRDIPLLAATLERGCSAKFAWHDGLRPPEPDWLPAPLGGAAPRWQPAVALLPPPID